MKKQIKKQKRNRKLLLLAALATFGVVGGTFGGTYAWFVASRTASANMGNMTASTLGNLQIRVGETGSYITGDAPEINDLTFTDISGDGTALYRPVLSSAAAEGALKFSTINTVTSATLGANAYYYVQDFYFRDTIENNQIFLNASSITGGNLATAYRVAFLNGSNELIQIVHDDGDTNYSLITSGTAVDTNGDLSGTVAITDAVYNGKYFDASDLTERTSIAATGTTYSNSLCTLTTSEEDGGTTYYSGHVRVAIWLEGQDDACVNANHDNITAIELNFYALNPTENA